MPIITSGCRRQVGQWQSLNLLFQYRSKPVIATSGSRAPPDEKKFQAALGTDSLPVAEAACSISGWDSPPLLRHSRHPHHADADQSRFGVAAFFRLEPDALSSTFRARAVPIRFRAFAIDAYRAARSASCLRIIPVSAIRPDGSDARPVSAPRSGFTPFSSLRRPDVRRKTLSSEFLKSLAPRFF